MGKEAKLQPRNFTRIKFSTRAEVEINDIVVPCELVDISINAMYVRCDAEAVVGDECDLRLFLGDEDPMIIHGIGHVVRRDALGVAISFKGFYCDNVEHLTHLNLLNIGQSGQNSNDTPKG